MKNNAKSVKDIVIEYLKKNGYDGLCNDNQCGCKLDHFMPCDGDVIACVPAYHHECEKCASGTDCDETTIPGGCLQTEKQVSKR